MMRPGYIGAVVGDLPWSQRDMATRQVVQQVLRYLATGGRQHIAFWHTTIRNTVWSASVPIVQLGPGTPVRYQGGKN